MIDFAGVDEVYSRKWLKKKLEEKYESLIYFVEMNGKSNVVCFRDAAEIVINDKWYESRKSNVEDEAERIVQQAAKIILGQVRATKYDTKVYPSYEDVSNTQLNKDWLPSYLRLF